MVRDFEQWERQGFICGYSTNSLIHPKPRPAGGGQVVPLSEKGHEPTLAELEAQITARERELEELKAELLVKKGK